MGYGSELLQLRLTPHFIDDEHWLDNIPRVAKCLGNVRLHCAHHTKSFCMACKTMRIQMSKLTMCHRKVDQKHGQMPVQHSTSYHVCAELAAITSAHWIHQGSLGWVCPDYFKTKRRNKPKVRCLLSSRYARQRCRMFQWRKAPTTLWVQTANCNSRDIWSTVGKAFT